jgi:hypothetical protein
MDDSERDEIIERGLKREREALCKAIGLPIVFFKRVAICLEEEIEKANGHLRNERGSTAQNPLELVRQPCPSKMRIELTYGASRACFVALLSNLSYIEVVMTNRHDKSGASGEQLLAFLLKRDDSSAKAYKVKLDRAPEVEGEFSAEQIAKAVVAGIIRGAF